MPRILVLFICICSAILHAQDGAIDLTFGNGGVVITPSAEGYDLAIQPDGKILTVGVIIDTVDLFGVIRYMPDGQRDTSFGNDGLLALPDRPFGATAWCIALQDDGKIVVVGGYNFKPPAPQPDMLIARYLPSGVLDLSFGTNGIVTWDAFGDLEVANCLIIQRDGKILVSGYTIETTVGLYAFLVRFTADGDLDESFGASGAIFTDNGCDTFEATGMAELEDGRIFVCANCKDGQPSLTSIHLMRFLPDGTYDTSFGNAGRITYDFDTQIASWRLEAQPDGKFVIATTVIDNTLRFAVSRFLPDGSADPAFGEDGISIIDIGPHIAYVGTLDVAIQPDEKIIAVGTAHNTDESISSELVIARLLPNGALDYAFGDSGLVKSNFIPGMRDKPTAVVLQPDHKIVVTGYIFDGPGLFMFVARYLSSFEPPPYDTLARDELFQLYPNPTADAFAVQFGLSHSTTISLDLYDVQGRYLQTLLEPQIRAEGIYTEPLILDANIPSGAYFLVVIRDGGRRCLPIVKQH